MWSFSQKKLEKIFYIRRSRVVKPVKLYNLQKQLLSISIYTYLSGMNFEIHISTAEYNNRRYFYFFAQPTKSHLHLKDDSK